MNSEVSSSKTNMSAQLPPPVAHLHPKQLTGPKDMVMTIDFSGLTPHEVAKIQQVMLRAKLANKQVTQQARKHKENFESLKGQVDSAKQAAVSTPSRKKNLCEICFYVDLHTTVGHSCSNCKRKFCFRCGHRTATSLHATSPNQWLCRLCYHERKYLSISGKWIANTQSDGDGSSRLKKRHTLSDLVKSSRGVMLEPESVMQSPNCKPTASCGKIKVQFGHVAAQSSLVFTIIQASGLQYRDGKDRKSQINPYCKVYLLPDRSEYSKRRTRTLTDTANPVWNRSFMYENVTTSALKRQSLEISLWSHRGHMRSRKFLGQVTISLNSVQFNNQPSVFHLEYPDSVCQNCPPSPIPSHSKRSNFTLSDYNPPQHFSYMKLDQQSSVSFDSGDSPEEGSLASMRLSRSYDTGLDELGGYGPQKLQINGMQSMKGLLVNRQHGDTKPSHNNTQSQNTFKMAAKRLLVKKDTSDEDPDALVAEFIKQKTKEESKRQTKEEQVGDIVRATHSRTPSPTQISNIEGIGGSHRSLSESNSNLVPAVEIDECAERALERSSTSPSLLDAQNSHRRHSAPNLPDDATPFRECSMERDKSVPPAGCTLPGRFLHHSFLTPPSIRMSSPSPVSSDDDISVISSTSSILSTYTGGGSMLGLGIGQLLRSNHIGRQPTGRIQLAFCLQEGHLKVIILSAEELAYHREDISANRKTAPYVKLYLLHGTKPLANEKEQRTKEAIVYTNPTFNEAFTFKCKDLVHKTLKVKVKHDDYKRGFMKQGKEIGQALVSVDSLHLSSEPFLEWYKLFPTKKE